MALYHRVQPDREKSCQEEEGEGVVSHNGLDWHGQNIGAGLYSREASDIVGGGREEGCA